MPNLLEPLFSLTHRDVGGVLAGPAVGFESASDTALTVIPELIGANKGQALIVQSLHVRGAAGAAQVCTILAVDIVRENGSQIGQLVQESFTGGNIRENMSFTAPVILLGGSWFLKASAIFDAGVNANSCFFNLQGYVIPRGNLSLMSVVEV